MANIKSAIKRVDIARKNEARNRSLNSGVKTAIRKFNEAIQAGNKDEAKDLLKVADKKLNLLLKKVLCIKTKLGVPLAKWLKV
ncbi:ribosomal protein S20 [Peptoniphilus sp. oral taxon 375 str. F0436]|nr:ribosomal protein S20 [Peptoniphilus sp. oral taxon 375 str. F0436]